MKLYLDNIQSVSTKNIATYKIATIKEPRLFSREGIFLVENDKYKKELVHDGEVTSIQYDDTCLIMDLSKISYEEENKIPYEHIYKEYVREVYHLRKKAIVALNLVYLDNILVNVYFESDYRHNDYVVKEDVLSFIKLIN